MENEKQMPAFSVFQKNWQQGLKQEYLSDVNMEHDSFQLKWLCYMRFVQNDG